MHRRYHRESFLGRCPIVGRRNSGLGCAILLAAGLISQPREIHSHRGRHLDELYPDVWWRVAACHPINVSL